MSRREWSLKEDAGKTDQVVRFRRKDATLSFDNVNAPFRAIIIVGIAVTACTVTVASTGSVLRMVRALPISLACAVVFSLAHAIRRKVILAIDLQARTLTYFPMEPILSAGTKYLFGDIHKIALEPPPGSQRAATLLLVTRQGHSLEVGKSASVTLNPVAERLSRLLGVPLEGCSPHK